MTQLATTFDRLYQDRLTLEQPEKGFRFGTDSMLLAAAVRAKKGQHVLEMGCGVGAALLVAALRCPEVKFTGIEREQDYMSLAQKNIEANILDARVSVVHGDATEKELSKKLGTFDHVIANPPFFQSQELHAINDLRRVAREEEEGGLAVWIKAANRFLKPKGTVTFIHSADRVDEITTGFKAFCGGIVVFPFWPTATSLAKRVIVTGTKGSKAPLQIHPGLVLHEKDDNYNTEAATQVIRFGKSIWE